MLTCSNCATEAVYLYRVTGEYSIPFCVPCLPKFLNSPQYRGRVVKVSSVVPEAAPAPKKRSTKKVVEEPVVEEPAPEESTEIIVEEADGVN